MCACTTNELPLPKTRQGLDTIYARITHCIGCISALEFGNTLHSLFPPPVPRGLECMGEFQTDWDPSHPALGSLPLQSYCWILGEDEFGHYLYMCVAPKR